MERGGLAEIGADARVAAVGVPEHHGRGTEQRRQPGRLVEAAHLGNARLEGGDGRGVVVRVKVDPGQLVEHRSLAAHVGELHEHLLGLRQHVQGVGVVALVVGELAGREQRIAACRAGGRVGSECLGQPCPPLAQMAALVPEGAQRRGQAHGFVGAGVDPETQRHAQVVQFAGQPRQVNGAMHRRRPLDAFGQFEIEAGMIAARGRFVAGNDEPVEGILADCLEQAVARGRVARRHLPHQVLVVERTQGRRVEAEGVHGVFLEAAGKDGQPVEQVALGGRQQLVAAMDGIGQCAVALRQVARPVGQHVQAAVVQLRQQRRQAEHADVRSAQFDGQRQAVECLAYGRNRGAILLGCGEVRLHGGGPFSKERHGSIRLQRRHLVALLGAQVQALACGGDDVHVRALLQEVLDERRAAQHMLQVVEHQQQLFAPQMSHDLHGRLLASGVEPQCQRQRGRYLVRLFHRRQLDEAGAVGVDGRQAVRHFQRQASFAHAGRAEQREQSPLVTGHALADQVDVAFSTDRGGGQGRQRRCGRANLILDVDRGGARHGDGACRHLPARAGGSRNEPGSQRRFILQRQRGHEALRKDRRIGQAGAFFQAADKGDAVGDGRGQIGLRHAGAAAQRTQQVAEVEARLGLMCWWIHVNSCSGVTGKADCTASVQAGQASEIPRSFCVILRGNRAAAPLHCAHGTEAQEAGGDHHGNVDLRLR